MIFLLKSHISERKIVWSTNVISSSQLSSSLRSVSCFAAICPLYLLFRAPVNFKHYAVRVNLAIVSSDKGGKFSNTGFVLISPPLSRYLVYFAGVRALGEVVLSLVITLPHSMQQLKTLSDFIFPLSVPNL